MSHLCILILTISVHVFKCSKHYWSVLMVHRDKLDTLGIPYKYPVVKTGVVGSVGKGEPVISLRADMDGLPIEVTTLSVSAMRQSILAAGRNGLQKLPQPCGQLILLSTMQEPEGLPYRSTHAGRMHACAACSPLLMSPEQRQ